MTNDGTSDTSLRFVPGDPGHGGDDIPTNPYAHFPGAVVEYDGDGGFVACSPAHREMFTECAPYFRPGFSRRNIIKAYAGNFADSGRWLEARLASLASIEKIKDVTLLDGRVIRVMEQETPGGGLVCTSTDITDLKNAGDVEANSDDKLRYFAKSSSEWLWETDENLRFVYCSPNIEQVLGTPPDWYYGKTREDMLGDDYDRSVWAEHLLHLRNREPFLNFSYFRVADDLESKWLSVSGQPFFDETGQFKGYRGIGRDITAEKTAELALQRSEAELLKIRATLEEHVEARTQEIHHEIAERERAEKALAESERRFRHAFEFAPNGIALLSPEGKRLKLNHALAEFLGSSVEALLDTSMNTAITNPEDYRTDNKLRQEVIQGIRTTYNNERSYRRMDGEIVWGEVTGSLVRDENGAPQYFVAHTVDTTERRRTEQLLREANEKLEQRVIERTSKLDASNAALQQENIERQRIEESLRESEARFQDFAKSASDWFWETDTNHRFKSFFDPQSMIPEAERHDHLGKTRQEIANVNLNDEQSRQNWEDMNAHRPFRNFQYTYTLDGSDYYLSINGRPVFDIQGNFTGYRGTGTDVTRQVRLEKKLSAQSTLLSSILDNLPVHVSLLNSDGRYIFINKYGADKMGRATVDFKGKLDEELFGPKDGANFRSLAMEVMQSRVPLVNATIQPVHWTDSEALLNIVPMAGSEDDSSSVLVVAQDVTDLSRAQAAIREREALLNAIVEHIPAFLTLLRVSDSTFQLTNERFNQIIGLDKDDIVGLTDADVHKNPEDLQIIDEHIRRVMETRKAITQDRMMIGVEERTRMSITKFPVFDEHDEIISIGTVSVDISEQRKVEEQLRQSQKMEVVGQLTGGVAHDFNNLLGVVIGNLDFLEEQLRDQHELHEMVKVATKAALHGGELTRQLLAFSRRQPLAPKSIDLNIQISQMHEMLIRTLGETVETSLVKAPNLWQCNADPSQVEAAILNLAINARDSMPNGGRLTLSTANIVLDKTFTAAEQELEPGEYVELSVTDTGTGMSHDVIDHAFEPFFTTKKVGQGSGLGLSMVFGFAKQSKGHVSLKSKVDQGTTVSLYLPRSSAFETAIAPSLAQEIPVGQGEKILVVEDDPDLRMLAVAQLEGLGYTIFAAENARDALQQKTITGRIDLLLTDVVLPGGMDGTALAREMTKHQADINVLFMSGYSEHSTFPDSTVQDIGLLQKPFRRAILAQKVHEALNS